MRSLDPQFMRLARDEELAYFESKFVCHKRPRPEAYQRMGRRRVKVNWMDSNPEYGSRLVAREVRHAGGETIFAPTPPLGSLRTVLSMAATDLAGDAKHFLKQFSIVCYSSSRRSRSSVSCGLLSRCSRYCR